MIRNTTPEVANRLLCYDLHEDGCFGQFGLSYLNPPERERENVIQGSALTNSAKHMPSTSASFVCGCGAGGRSLVFPV